MLTIYAGPFEENFCLKSVRKEFGRCGPIQSLTVVTETYQVRSTQSVKLADRRARPTQSLAKIGISTTEIPVWRVFSGGLVTNYNN